MAHIKTVYNFLLRGGADEAIMKYDFNYERLLFGQVPDKVCRDHDVVHFSYPKKCAAVLMDV